jgi:hypothetical protein
MTFPSAYHQTAGLSEWSVSIARRSCSLFQGPTNGVPDRRTDSHPRSRTLATGRKTRRPGQRVLASCRTGFAGEARTFRTSSRAFRSNDGAPDGFVASGWNLCGLARSERFELPTLGFEVRCSIQLSYERVSARLPDLAGEGYPKKMPSKSLSWPGFVPAIHVFFPRRRKAWMPGSSPGMTTIRHPNTLSGSHSVSIGT